MPEEEENLIEFTPFGGESEDDVTKGLATEVSKAVLWSTDWTIETILRQLEKGNIELNPEFQRREAWNDSKKSLFIESLLLNLPVPQIVLAERKDRRGAYIVIDGKQRLLAIRRFCAKPDDELFKPFKLSGLLIREDLNGASYEGFQTCPELAEDLRIFENQTIRTTIIRNWPTENFLYAVFLRLNTGSLPLSPQELRQALHPGPFLTFADTYTQDSSVIHGLLKKKGADFRMRDVELFVRFFAFREFLSEYNGNLKTFLDKACAHFSSQWATLQPKVICGAKDFEKAILITEEVFGKDVSFRKWTPQGYESRFNRAVFDVMTYYFSGMAMEVAIKNKEAIEEAFKKLCVNDTEFLKSIESTTKSITATATRFGKWGDTLKSVVPFDISVPKLVSGKIVIS